MSAPIQPATTKGPGIFLAQFVGDAPPCGRTGDIGTHAYQLAHFVSGMMPDQIFAELTSSQSELNDELDKEKEPSDMQDGPQVVLGGRSQARVQSSRCSLQRPQ